MRGDLRLGMLYFSPSPAPSLEVAGQGRALCARDLVNNVANMDKALSTIHLFHLLIIQPDNAASRGVGPDQTKRSPSAST